MKKESASEIDLDAENRSAEFYFVIYVSIYMI